MSASQEKKKRLEEKASGAEKKNERIEKELKEKKKIKTLAIVVVAVVVVLLAIALFINSNYVRRNLTAVRINDVDYTVTDCNYYYYQGYYEYYSTIYSSFSDYADTMLPSTDKPLGSQIYDEETGQTWAEFFDEMALAQMQEDALILSEARKAGYELSDDSRAKFEEEIQGLADTVATNASFTDLDQYLEAYYGEGMNEECLRRVIEMKYIVDDFAEYKQNSFEYTEDEIETHYDEKSTLFDVYDYRYFLVYADEVEEDDFDGDDDAYNAAKDEAMAKAKEQADGYAARIKTEADIIEIAREYDAEAYAEDDSTQRIYRGELLGSIYGDWLREDGRKANDVYVTETTTGYYVVLFNGRDNNHYNTVDARIITATPEEVNADDYADDEDTTAYNNAVESARQDAFTEAKTFYDQWITDGEKEEDLEALFLDHSDNTDTEDGLYENIYRDQFTDDVDAWLYDSARKPGDHTIIQTVTSTYVVYFVGEGEQYSTVLSREDMQEDDYSEWKESLGEAEVSKKWTYALAE